MQNLVLTQLSVPEVRQIFRDELANFFSQNKIVAPSDDDEIGGIELAIKITGKAKPTIYGLVSARAIPHFKRGSKLYFSRKALLDWIESGKRKTQSEIALEAENFSPENPDNQKMT